MNTESNNKEEKATKLRAATLRVSPQPCARLDRSRRHQAAIEPARPVARVLARWACEEIAADPHVAAKYISCVNLAAVIPNGTAGLGPGNIGPLAFKPVMEGKGCLFKRFAGVNVIDLELAEMDPDKLVDAIAMLEPTVGGSATVRRIVNMTAVAVAGLN